MVSGRYENSTNHPSSESSKKTETRANSTNSANRTNSTNGAVREVPRVLVAAPASGSGKTMITTGLLAALTRAGYSVSPHKVGPDYIDPGYHAAACGRPGRNLDAHLVGEQRILPLLLHGALTPIPADIAVIEGVMGLFDGALGTRGFASSAHVAALTGTPVILVVNCASSSRSVGAVVKGFASFDQRVRVAGVILNNTASPRHEAEARAAVEETGVPVVGSVPRVKDVVVPSRHLGLIPAAERASEATEAVNALAAVVANHVDLDRVVSLAKCAPAVEVEPWSPQIALAEAGVAPPSDNSDGSPRPTVAVAGGTAFTFGYTENTELLHAAGADVVAFDPVHDQQLPPGTDALVLPGGFPEVYASALARNTGMREAVRRFAESGRPVVAECAGMLYLGRTLDGQPMAGALPIRTEMSPRLAMGYRTATALTDSVLAPAGTTVTGHVFHRTRVTGMDGDPPPSAWSLEDARGQTENDGFVAGPRASVHASYLHTHWAGHPRFAATLVEAARRARTEADRG